MLCVSSGFFYMAFLSGFWIFASAYWKVSHAIPFELYQEEPIAYSKTCFRVVFVFQLFLAIVGPAFNMAQMYFALQNGPTMVYFYTLQAINLC